jgi:hypothetical protein
MLARRVFERTYHRNTWIRERWINRYCIAAAFIEQCQRAEGSAVKQPIGDKRPSSKCRLAVQVGATACREYIWLGYAGASVPSADWRVDRGAEIASNSCTNHPPRRHARKSHTAACIRSVGVLAPDCVNRSITGASCTDRRPIISLVGRRRARMIFFG